MKQGVETPLITRLRKLHMSHISYIYILSDHISYHISCIISYRIVSYIISYGIMSHHITSYRILCGVYDSGERTDGKLTNNVQQQCAYGANRTKLRLMERMEAWGES